MNLIYKNIYIFFILLGCIQIVNSIKEDSKIIQQKTANLVSSHTAAFSKDNLIKKGITSTEYSGWENAVRAIVGGTPVSDFFEKNITELHQLLLQLHTYSRSHLENTDLNSNDASKFLNDKKNAIDNNIKKLRDQDLKYDNLLRSVRDFQLATFYKLKKEIDRILLSISKTTTKINADLPLIKKRLSVVKKSEIEEKINSIKNKELKNKISDMLSQINIVLEELSSSFSVWLEGSFIEIPEFTAENKHKYSEQVKMYISQLRNLQSNVMIIQTNKSDVIAQEVINNFLVMLTEVKKEMNLLSEALNTTDIIRINA